MRPPLILLCLLAYQCAIAQSSLPAFGDFTAEEKNMKECSFDKKAEAVILFDDASSDHDDNYRLITHHRVRIKIFHQREVDRGNVRIRFYSKDKFEYIANVKGVTYNDDNGRSTLNYLDNKSIFTTKDNDLYSSVKFALPNVKTGSIIEYEYDSYMNHYGGLNSWEFQNEIPTIKSCYMLTMLPGVAFQYSVQKKYNYPIIIKPIPDQGKTYFEMNNIPGLKFEPYMDAVRDYLQRVEFQLSSYTSRSGNQAKVNQTWKDLAYDLVTDKDFGGAIRKDLPNIDVVKNLVAKETTDSGRVAAIYNYVRNNLSWNGYYSKYLMEGIKNVWEKKSGSVGEINLLLVNLLQTFKIDAYPMLAAERSFGKVDSTYPFLDRFNKVVAFVRTSDGKTYILDATEKFCPPGLTPYPLLNTIAFIVDKKDFNLVRVLTRKNSYNNTVNVDAKLSADGSFKGTGQISSSGYAKQLRTEKIKREPKSFAKDILQEAGSDLIVDNCIFENLDDDNNPLIQKVEFHTEQNISGGFAFVNCNMFTGFAKNPFTADERFTNINFGYPYSINLQVNVELPPNSKVDKLPPDRVVSSSDNSLVVTRKLKLENNTLVATIQFIQTATLVDVNYYNTLKSNYKQAIDLMNEPVVVKISN